MPLKSKGSGLLGNVKINLAKSFNESNKSSTSNLKILNQDLRLDQNNDKFVLNVNGSGARLNATSAFGTHDKSDGAKNLENKCLNLQINGIKRPTSSIVKGKQSKLFRFY